MPSGRPPRAAPYKWCGTCGCVGCACGLTPSGLHKKEKVCCACEILGRSRIEALSARERRSVFNSIVVKSAARLITVYSPHYPQLRRDPEHSTQGPLYKHEEASFRKYRLGSRAAITTPLRDLPLGDSGVSPPTCLSTPSRRVFPSSLTSSLASLRPLFF